MLVAMSTTATVLGFFVLTAICAVLVWGCVVILRVIATALDAWRYNLRRKRKDDDEFSEIKSIWLQEKLGMCRTDTVEREAVVVESVDRIDTEVFPNLTPDYIESTYWKDANRDAS